MTIARDFLKYFASQRGRGRGMNDGNNKIREEVLKNIFELPSEYLEDPDIATFIGKLRNVVTDLIKSRYTGDYNKIKLEPRGGRGNKHDFEIKLYLKDQVVFNIPLEFKHGASNINQLPEYLSVAANRYVELEYATYFYQNYLPRICELDSTLQMSMPSLDVYRREVYKNSSKHNFFLKLDELEKNQEFYKSKRRITHESIASFMELQRNLIDIDRINREIQESQSNKVFLLWDCKDFHIETLKQEELTLTKLANIKNKNTYVFDTLVPGTKHKFLLRWKNHLGVLFPAWQISLSR